MRADAAVQRRESVEAGRLDRELNELLQELRVAQNGIQILVGFLLVIPFTQRFNEVTSFQRDVYYLSLLAAGAASIACVAPVSYHRLLFRRRAKHVLVTRGHAMAIMALGLLALAILGVLVLVTDFLFSGVLTACVAVIYLVLVAVLWYALPLHSRRQAACAEEPAAP